MPDRYPQTHPTFVVDKEVAADVPSGRDIDMVGSLLDQSHELDGLAVQTMRSTDEGLAIYVDCQGATVYHAGDLNVWWWPNRDVSLNGQSIKDCTTYCLLCRCDAYGGVASFLYAIDHTGRALVLPKQTNVLPHVLLHTPHGAIGDSRDVGREEHTL